MADAVHHDAALDITVAFTLHLHKPLLSQVDKAAWNPDKDLLAMVTRDHHIIVHRFNWQRLWAISPETKVTSLCWRPDGKALAVGYVDGSIAIHDVENGDVLRQQTTHDAAVECLYWAQEGQESAGHVDDVFCYEDRTSRFFPSPPHIPPMPGTVSSFDMSGVSGHAAEGQSHANRKNVFRAVHERLNILCSGDRNGIICLSAFGVFPIGKLNIRDLAISGMNVAKPACRLLDAAALQWSPISGELANYGRRKELRQVALQASSVEKLLEVVEATVIVMRKHWSEATSTFEDKIRSLSTLLLEHSSPVKPRDEFLSILACGSASAALHQFLVASLGEAGLKRLAKCIDTAGRELHNLIAEHLQAIKPPAFSQQLRSLHSG